MDINSIVKKEEVYAVPYARLAASLEKLGAIVPKE